MAQFRKRVNVTHSIFPWILTWPSNTSKIYLKSKVPFPQQIVWAQELRDQLFVSFFFFNSKIISESCGKQPESNRKNTPLELYRISKHKESTANSAGLCNCSPLVCLISFLPGQPVKVSYGTHQGGRGKCLCY